MRVFISADMEGIATTTDWEETQKGTVDYPASARQMTAEAALKQDLTNALCTLPPYYVFEVSYKEHFHAVKYANYPGFEKIGSHTIRMETDNLTDILRAITFVL